MTSLAHSFEQPHKRQSRLAQLGLTEQIVRDIVDRGLAARKTCTAFDTPSFPGYLQWAMMHRASRELLARHDWTPDDSRNFSRVVRPDGAMAMTVATGDEFTGRKPEPGLPEPSTKYPKGTETDLAIVANVQLRLWDDTTEHAQAGSSRPVRETWWLLSAVVDGELRYELSCPEGQDDRGYIVGWSQRIIFDPVPVDGNRGDDDDNSGTSQIDVPVERL